MHENKNMDPGCLDPGSEVLGYKLTNVSCCSLYDHGKYNVQYVVDSWVKGIAGPLYVFKELSNVVDYIGQCPNSIIWVCSIREIWQGKVGGCTLGVDYSDYWGLDDRDCTRAPSGSMMCSEVKLISRAI